MSYNFLENLCKVASNTNRRIKYSIEIRRPYILRVLQRNGATTKIADFIIVQTSMNVQYTCAVQVTEINEK